MLKTSIYSEFTKAFLALATFSLMTCMAAAQTVTNGSITGAPVQNSGIGAGNAAGWTVCGFSPDLCDIGFPAYNGGSQVAVSASPDGGTWLGMAAVGAGECAQTTITGLTPGNNYTLCFYGACFGTGALFNSSPSNPDICVGGTCQTFVIPMAANTWTLYTMNFTAAAATEVLSCTLGGDDSYCALDGFTISIPGATATWTDPSPLCDTDPPINLDTYVTGTPGGVWSGTGVTGNTFDPSGGTQNVTYTVNPGGCDEVSQTIAVTVTPCVSCDPAWTTTALCSTDPPLNLDGLITGDPGGTWTGTGVTGNMFDPSSGSQSITYTAPGACDSTQTITVNTTAVATWTPPAGLCDSDAPIDLNTLVTGTAGGTWSGVGVTGNMFDPSSGTQTITYDVGVAPCDASSAQVITVGVSGNPAWNPPVGLCTGAAPIDLNTLITGDPGGTWSGTGVTGSMFDPSGGSQTVTYDVGAAPCNGTSAQLITVTAAGDASWTPPLNTCIGDAPFDLNAFVTGTAGGTWSGTNVTGSMFDPSGGTQSITYSVGTVPCDATSVQNIVVTAASDPSWTTPINVCESDAPIDLNTLITGDIGGTWSGTGVTGNMFDPASGSQNVTYTVGSGGCQGVLAQMITVNTAPDPSWTPPTLCTSSAPVNLTTTVTGQPGGTWSGTGMTGSVFDPFFGTQAITYSVTASGCTATSTQNVNVVDPQVTIAGTNVSCFGLTDGAAQANVTGGSGNYTYSWDTTPPQTTSNATGLGAGTYTVTVTDVDGGCSVTETVTLIEPAEILLVMTGEDACTPALGSASVVASGGVGGFIYNWTPVASTASSVTGLDSVMATVVVTDGNGCSATDSVFVNVWPDPTISVNPDTLIYYGDEATLWASGGVSYSWTPNTNLDCDDCMSPLADPIETTQYCVTVTDSRGCQKDTCTMVTVEIVCGEVFVPSAFSPNEDGENDNLCVYSDCMDYMTFTIYNRWGEKVYETNTLDVCWDGTWKGKLLNSAVFVYVLDGYLINGQSVLQKGNISLVR